MTTALLLAAMVADSWTYLLMGVEHEMNPLVASVGPSIALAIKWAIVIALLVILRMGSRSHIAPTSWRNPRRFLLIGASIGVIGAASNVRVIAILAGYSWI